ncbi:MAG: hypothetical protein FJ098_04315 [Deltaproteobacteria bacterium]|nr:hypothetical protein [Deltaproteobacteria bacterium]
MRSRSAAGGTMHRAVIAVVLLIAALARPAAAAEEPPLRATLYPPPLQVKERLRLLTLELWCAERRGADDAALMRLYLKHSFPPLETWHDVWNQALDDAAWVRDLYDEVRRTCPLPGEAVPPPPAGGSTSTAP